MDQPRTDVNYYHDFYELVYIRGPVLGIKVHYKTGGLIDFVSN